jgi:hypothetical protein
VTESELLNLIGLTAEDFHRVRQAPSFEEAENALVVLKDQAKKGYRKQVFELHPDRNEGDEAKAQTLQALNDLMGKLDRLRVQRPAPPPQMRWVPWNNSSSTSSSTTYGGVSVSFYVNGVRVS